MGNIKQQLFHSGYLKNSKGNTFEHKASSVDLEVGVLLYDFVRKVQPEKTLEIGMAYGVSTVCICQAHRENRAGSHTAIDPFEEQAFKSEGLRNIERENLKDILRFYPRSSDEVLPQLCSQNEQFDFAFIDECHLFDFALVDFFYIDKLLKVGGHVAFDDLWMPGVRKVVSFVLKNKGYQFTSFPSKTHTSPRTRVLRAGRRILQNPLGLDWGLKLASQNVALLQKVTADSREWQFHRAF